MSSSTATEVNSDVSPRHEEETTPSASTSTRRVHFPSDEAQLRMISIAPEPFANQPLLSLGVILQRYRAACQRLQVRPLNSLLDQLTTMDDTRRTFDDRLSSLNIVHEKLDSKQMDAIEEILSRCRFHRLDLDSSIYDDTTLIQFFDVIEYYESCTHLNLSNHRSISPQGYQALTRYLRRTRFLERLDMNYVRFDDPSMFAFGRALRMASTLYELHLESCQLNGKILQKFIQNLRAAPTIRELYLCDNRLQIQDSLLINELIRSCGQNLHLLDLRSNSLQDAGISHIASQLSQYDEHHSRQNSIGKISFQSNEITHQGVAFLSKCLLHNRTLHSLNLSYNNLTNEGLFLLRDALLTNRMIHELILRSCRLTDQAAIALAEFIAESTTIQYLDLRENNIQASGICGIAIAMKMNQSLLKIDFDPIIPSLTNSSVSVPMTNIDRTKNNSSLLSFSNLRRMTVGFGNSTPNNNAVGSNQDLIEQKSKWMKDIYSICQRNQLLYEEYLHEQEQQRLSLANHHDERTNGIDQHDSAAVNDENGVDEEDDEQIRTSVEDILEMIKDTVSNGNDDEEEPTSFFSLADPNDEVEENKRKLHHSDSLHLLRKKVQNDETDKPFDDVDDDQESSA